MGLQTAGQSLAMGAANAIVPGSGALVGAVGTLGGSLVDAFDRPDSFGHQSNLAAALKGNLKGGTLGAVGALISNIRSKGKEAAYKDEFARTTHAADRAAATSRVAADPTLTRGNLYAGYYAAGGYISSPYSAATSTGNLVTQKTTGGSVRALSTNDSTFSGPSHEQGGIDLPNQDAQVEGGETAAGGYVFSKRLGFAQAHKPIARAIGKIEQKPQTPERAASMKLLHKKENDLKLSQEYLKHELGID